MTDTVYNMRKGFYSRKRNNAYLDPFVAIKHIQKTNRVSSSQYTDVKSTHIGSLHINNGKHGSYDRYIRKLKSPIIKSKGSKTGIVKGCKCGTEPELTNSVKTIDITYTGPTYNVGSYVYAIKDGKTYYEKGAININNGDGTYEIEFINSGNTIQNVSKVELEPYFECKCGTNKNGKIFISNPSIIGEQCGSTLNNDYFMQMGGYYKRVVCI
tara:strand:+ start:61 stop:696 length:636 start_codon:yes stop_codon:yes gene_type:complete